MTAECRPPDGTPDGTVCWLTNGKYWVTMEWDGRIDDQWNTTRSSPGVWWWRIEGGYNSPFLLSRRGYRFHSIAQTPEDAK